MKQKPHADRTPRIIISMLCAIIIGIVVAMAMNSWMQGLLIRQYFAKDSTNAVWDWANVSNHTDQDLRSTADFLYAHQINTVFIDMGTVATDLAGNDKTVQRDAKTKDLERYVMAMQKRNIRVFVSAGDPNWSKPAYQSIPMAIQQYVFDFNKNHTAKIAGIEFDIESYNQEQFADASMTEKELVLDEYLDLVDRLASAQEAYAKNGTDKNLELGFAIPYWFDNENKNIKSVSWHNKTGPALFHILDRLNSLPQSNVVVMAYRNAATGNDGMIYHSRAEVEYAQSNAPHVSVLIGIETTNVEPAKITFYGRTLTEVSSEVNIVDAEFRSAQTMKGIAINDLAGLRALDQNN